VACRGSSLPRGLADADVAAVLAASDVRTCVGLRDQAILLLMARLGLRGGEIAAVRLEDIHWRAGEMEVRGKGSRIERMPLPADAGQALAAYLTGPASDRPRGCERVVFLTVRAPFLPLSLGAIRSVMPRACRAAGLPAVGGHRLRHSLATRVLRAGAPLPEVAQLLRQRNLAATSIYAKVDYEALREVAAPWPLPAGEGSRR
jgi:site-specific recombinase XerD